MKNLVFSTKRLGSKKLVKRQKVDAKESCSTTSRSTPPKPVAKKKAMTTIDYVDKFEKKFLNINPKG